nr:MAG TPA: hypothetical protein [Bacteriophage sp.]
MPFVFHCFASALNALEKFINFNSIRDWPGKVKGKVYPRKCQVFLGNSFDCQ